MGAVTLQDGENAFVHKSQVPFWTIFLNPGDKVEYNKEYTTKGLQAVQIKVM